MLVVSSGMAGLGGAVDDPHARVHFLHIVEVGFLDLLPRRRRWAHLWRRQGRTAVVGGRHLPSWEDEILGQLDGAGASPVEEARHMPSLHLVVVSEVARAGAQKLG